MKALILLTSFFSVTAMAEWTCYPSPKNEFSAKPLSVKVTSKKITIREEGANGYYRVGEAKLQAGAVGDSRFIQFDANLYSTLELVKASYIPSDHAWYGEGYGQVYFDRALVKGAERGRLAMAWCYHWCNYDYFVCKTK